MLYAYLLTRSEFHIESAPAKSTRDSRFAYTLYLDLLLMILQLSGCKVKPGNTRGRIEFAGDSNPLSGTALANALSADINIRELIGKGSPTLDNYEEILPALHAAICDSEILADYRRKKGRKTLADDVKLWTVLLSTVLAKDNGLREAARKTDDFTLQGFSKAFEMAAATLNSFADSRTSLNAAKKALNDSLEKAYELYVSLLLLPGYITRIEAERIEAAKEKYCPTDEELNPNMRFVRNRFVKAIEENESVQKYIKGRNIAWEENYYMLKNMLDAVLASDLYKEYMEADTVTFQDDCEFWRQVLKNVIFPGDALAEALENNSVYWNDDLAVMGTFTLKTIRQMAAADTESPRVELLPTYKNEDDANFGPQLFIGAIENRDEYRGYIDRFINDQQWDPERLAFTDIVILLAAITELLHCPTIPVPVTLNEYIEIANYYSTSRSGQFINGVLYSIVNYLKEQGKLLK